MKADLAKRVNKGKSGESRPAQPPKCPECGSQRIWKKGFRKTSKGPVQRRICRECGYRFSPRTPTEPKNLILNQKFTTNIGFLRQLKGAKYAGTNAEGPKNLVEVESRTEKWPAGATARATAKPLSTEIRGKIIEFLWFMKKQGYKPSTVDCKIKMIKMLLNKGANIFDPDDVKRVIAIQETWKDSTKAKAVDDYSTFLTMQERTWKPPRYRKESAIPFIPSETELDQLIAASGKKMASYLQGLKETGAGAGELWRLEWAEVDRERKVVSINHPVKGHNSRMLPISEEWISMLARLPKRSERVFNGGLDSHSADFRVVRKRISARLSNPRMRKIFFRTFRHWRGTMEYHHTKDIIHVQRMLGHKSIKNTMIYINLENALFQSSNDEFHVRAAETVEEASKLGEVGFEKFDEFDGVHLYRKRK